MSPLHIRLSHAVPRSPEAILLTLFLVCSVVSSPAQSVRSQLPSYLKNSFLEVNIGYINYPFGQQNLESGYTLQSVRVPHTAVRLIFFGHEITKHLSVQLSYMRPVVWVTYDYSFEYTLTRPDSTRSQAGPPGSGQDTVKKKTLFNNGSVWMNVAGLSLKFDLPLRSRFSLFGEAGISLVTRGGFRDYYTLEPVIRDANYLTVLVGGGVKYHLNKKWAFQVSVTYTPPNRKVRQPYTVFYSAGFTFKILEVPEKQVEKAARLGFIHPKQMIQVGYTTYAFGYGVNDFIADKLYLFWGGAVEVTRGLSLNYQRNLFYSPRVFSLDCGVNFSYLQSRINEEQFYALSVFPVLRFTLLRTRPLDLYLFYVIAGPTFISRTTIDDVSTGEHFTFYDNLGSGIFVGENRNFNAEIKLGHYSNGNIFTSNPGIKIPLTFSLGYTF